MMAPTLNRVQKKSFYRLLWPYFFEILLGTVTGYITTQMLSAAGNLTASSASVSNQVINMFYLVFQIISNGAGIVMAQAVGARDEELKSKTAAVSLSLAAGIGLLGSLIIIFLGNPILTMMNMAPEIVALGTQYMLYIGFFFLMQSVSFTIGQIVYSYGQTRVGMTATLVADIANVGLNALLIFGVPALGIPALGVIGAAIGTIIGRIIYFIFVLSYLRRTIHFRFSFKELRPFPKNVLRHMIASGLPATGENITYALAQLVIVSFIAKIGTTGVIAKTYFDPLASLTYIFATAVGGASAIFVGQEVGAGDFDHAERTTRSGIYAAVTVSGVLSFALIFAVVPLGKLFTTDPQVLAIMQTIAVIDFFLEISRAINLVVIRSLKASGDARYTFLVGVIVQWTFIVPLAYVLGIVLQWGMLGIWLAIAADETIRMIIELTHWMRGRWRSKAYIKKVLSTLPVH